MATAPPRLEPDAVVVEDYLLAMHAADRRTGQSTTRAARSCQAKIRRAGGWGRLNRAEQLDAVVKAPSFASWLVSPVASPSMPSCSAPPTCGSATRHGCTAPTITTGSTKSILRSRFRGAVEHARQDHRDHRCRCPRRPRRRVRPRPNRHDRRLRRPGQAEFRADDGPLFHRLQLTLFHAGHLTTLHRAPTKPAALVTGWSTVTREHHASQQVPAV
jgi:integrase/recombinase XerD